MRHLDNEKAKALREARNQLLEAWYTIYQLDEEHGHELAEIRYELSQLNKRVDKVWETREY